MHPAKHYKRPKDMPMVAWETWTDMRRRDDIKKLGLIFPFGIMPKNWAIKIKQSYFASATYIDDLIGQLLSHVNKKNTIIVLTSDHGSYVQTFSTILPGFNCILSQKNLEVSNIIG